MEKNFYHFARKALTILERAGHKALLAGGCVRDRLRGIEPKDYDIATTALPEETMHVFRQAHKKTIPTGIKHGTITYLSPAGAIEITTLRADIATDGRHVTKLAFSKDFAEDAARRDFTVNAMFADRTGKIYDYFGGQKDLAARKLVFVGEPAQRIKEDYLRIMRLFRFWAQLGFTPDNRALDAVQIHAYALPRISQERITSELLRIIAEKGIEKVITALIRRGVWAVILPETSQLSPSQIALLNACDHLPVENRWLGRLQIVFATLDKLALANTARRLRLSNTQKRELITAVCAPLAICEQNKGGEFERRGNDPSHESEAELESGKEPSRAERESGKEPSRAELESGKEPSRAELESGKEPSRGAELERGKEPSRAELESGKEPSRAELESGKEPSRAERVKAMELVDAIEKQSARGDFLQKFYPMWQITKPEKTFLQALQFLADTENNYGHLRVAELPLNGNTLMRELHLKSGREIGDMLRLLRKRYRAEEWQTPAEGLALAKEVLTKIVPPKK